LFCRQLLSVDSSAAERLFFVLCSARNGFRRRFFYHPDSLLLEFGGERLSGLAGGENQAAGEFEKPIRIINKLQKEKNKLK
jgi:hypothetical protein